ESRRDRATPSVGELVCCPVTQGSISRGFARPVNLTGTTTEIRQEYRSNGMADSTLNINGQSRQVTDVDPDTPLLWILRDELNLVGTKFGCGIAQCGACTVHLNGAPVRSCQLPVSGLDGLSITTIEGLAPAGTLHPLQQAWIDHDVPQCGYCQAGQIMSAAALPANNPAPRDRDTGPAMSGTVFRRGTYQPSPLPI